MFLLMRPAIFHNRFRRFLPQSTWEFCYFCPRRSSENFMKSKVFGNNHCYFTWFHTWALNYVGFTGAPAVVVILQFELLPGIWSLIRDGVRGIDIRRILVFLVFVKLSYSHILISWFPCLACCDASSCPQHSALMPFCRICLFSRTISGDPHPLLISIC